MKNLVFLFLLFLIGIVVFLFFQQKPNLPLISINPTPSHAPSDNESSQNENKTGLKIPPNSRILVYAQNLINPRVLLKDSLGNLLVSVTSQGKVVAIPDKNKDGVGEAPFTLLSGLRQPHGLALYCQPNCKLYVAETNAVKVYDYDAVNLNASNPKKIIDLPSGGGHFTRSLLITKASKLLVSIGSSCNVCNEADERRASIWSANLDGSGFKLFAKGLRNSVFMKLNPATNEIWATEMGRDLLGDNTPPDEINIIQEAKDYGWPNCYGKQILDTTFSTNKTCSQTVSSLIDLQAHSAPLGLDFFGQDLLVSFHGSWNRTIPTGYKIVRVNANGQISDFVTGFLTDKGEVVGRPADILVDNKDIFISDDRAGMIYKLTIEN